MPRIFHENISSSALLVTFDSVLGRKPLGTGNTRRRFV